MKDSITIFSWNVNGIRASVNKGLFEIIGRLDPDIFCIQETKAQDNEVRLVSQKFTGYNLFINSAEKKGYSGTAVYTRIKPINYSNDIGITEHDTEGRVITLEFNSFYLVNVYVPNSGQDLKRLVYRKHWDIDLLNYLKNLDANKSLILTGDLNVANEPIDLARPAPNYNKSAGYTQTEIDGFRNFLGMGLTDTFRYFHKDKVQYTFWNQRFNARVNNVGWRIDYFLVSNGLIGKIKDSFILDEIMGSDHCPVGMVMEMQK